MKFIDLFKKVFFKKSIVFGEATVNGLFVQTFWTKKRGYETTITDSRGTLLVDCYKNSDQAISGHLEWIEKAKTMKTVNAWFYEPIVGSDYLRGNVKLFRN